MKSNNLGYNPNRKRIVLEIDRQPDIRDVIARLHHKTGINNSADIIRLALKQLDANLPAAPAAGTLSNVS